MRYNSLDYLDDYVHPSLHASSGGWDLVFTRGARPVARLSSMTCQERGANLLDSGEMLVEPAERVAPPPPPWPWPKTSAAELAQRAHRARIRRLVVSAAAALGGVLGTIVAIGLVFG